MRNQVLFKDEMLKKVADISNYSNPANSNRNFKQNFEPISTFMGVIIF